MSKPKRPRDTNQLAKFIVDIATGDVEVPKNGDSKDPAAVVLGRKGGLKGGEGEGRKALRDPPHRDCSKSCRR